MARVYDPPVFRFCLSFLSVIGSPELQRRSRASQSGNFRFAKQSHQNAGSRFLGSVLVYSSSTSAKGDTGGPFRAEV
jgi:hypothetical protein